MIIKIPSDDYAKERAEARALRAYRDKVNAAVGLSLDKLSENRLNSDLFKVSYEELYSELIERLRRFDKELIDSAYKG